MTGGKPWNIFTSVLGAAVAGYPASAEHVGLASGTVLAVGADQRARLRLSDHIARH